MPDATPNYLTVDAQGNIGADFSGHIRAAGLDLNPSDPGSETTPAANHLVRWVRLSDGAVIADLQGIRRDTGAFPFSSAAISAYDPDAVGAESHARLIAINSPNSAPATAQVRADIYTHNGANNFSATVLNDLGQSNFLQTSSPTGPLGSAVARRSFSDLLTFTWPATSVNASVTISHPWNTLNVHAIMGCPEQTFLMSRVSSRTVNDITVSFVNFNSAGAPVALGIGNVLHIPYILMET